MADAAATSPRRIPAPLLVVAGAALWGSTGTAQALGPDSSTPLQVGALRIVIGATALGALVTVMRRREEVRALVGVGARAALLVAAVAIAAYQVLFFAGVDATGVAVGTLVGIGSAPIATGLISATMGRRPPPRWLVGTAVTMAGAAVLVLGRGDMLVDGAGVAMAVGAGTAYAIYTITTKRLLDDGHAPVATMAVSWAGGALLLAPLLLTGDLGWVASRSGLATVAWLGVATVAVAYVLYAYGLRRLDAATVSTLTLAEPLTATLLAVVVLDEHLTAGAAAGVALMITGLLVVGGRAGRALGRKLLPTG